MALNSRSNGYVYGKGDILRVMPKKVTGEYEISLD